MHLKLFMVMIGCRPAERLTEQHDIFFGIAGSMKDLIPQMKKFWPEAKGNIHVDAYREVNFVDGHTIRVIARSQRENTRGEKLFFVNLGGYKPDVFDEFHHKMLAVAKSSGLAIQQAKQTAFYSDFNFQGAASHVDDKYGVDIDEIYAVNEILDPAYKERFSLEIIKQDSPEDPLHIGYFPLKSFN